MTRNEKQNGRDPWPIGLLLPALIVLSLLVTIVPAEQQPPAANEVIDAFIKTTGGQKAYEKVSSRLTRASLELVGQGITLDVTIWAERPNRNFVRVEAEAIGRIDKGTDGQTVWETSLMTGPQIKEGTERADYLRESTFDKFLLWKQLYSPVEVLGIEEIEGRPCVALAMSPENGNPQKWYFDRESHLLVKVEFVSESPTGTIPISTYLGDYREVDGLLLPHQARIVALGMERKLTTIEIEHDVAFPADQFSLPADVKELLDSRTE